MDKFISMSGKKFGRLTVSSREKNNVRGDARWLCLCDCGNKKSLRQNMTKSCGCITKEFPNNKTHGMSDTPTYQSWEGLKQRCSNPKDKKWKYYGGRGISFCARWDKFENFLSDMGVKPEGLTIDRINNDGNYCPGNCQWATYKQQANNQRRPKHIVHTKSRTERRKNHNNIRLSEEKVKFIRDSIANNDKISIKQFSLEFNVAPRTIRDVINGVSWLP